MQPPDAPPNQLESGPTAGNDFEQHRARLMGLAYRMLGSAAEAEDAVQDAWLRWQSADTGAIADAGAWLSTTVVRLCIDRGKSARARRETYPGAWLPEPVLTTALGMLINFHVVLSSTGEPLPGGIVPVLLI